MKNLLFLFIAVTLLGCNSKTGAQSAKSANSNYPASNEKLHWLTIEEALELNKTAPRDMIVDVYTQWCGPCKMMDRMTFSDPGVIDAIHEKYYAVKFDAESAKSINFGGKEYGNPQHDPNKPKNRRNSPHEFSRFLKVRGYPSLVIIGSDLNVKNALVGFKQPDQLLPLL